MENQLNFKTPDGTDVTLTFSPEGKLLVNLKTDTTPLTITVKSPTLEDTTNWVGGMKKKVD